MGLFLAIQIIFPFEPPTTSLQEQHNLVIYRDNDKYCAFPSVYIDEAEMIWVSFGWNRSGRHGNIGDEERGTIVMRAANPLGKWEEVTDDPPLELDRNIILLPNGNSVKLSHHGWVRIEVEYANFLKERGVFIKEFKNNSYAGYKASLVLTDNAGIQRTRVIEASKDMKSLFGFGRMIYTTSGVLLKPVYSISPYNSRIASSWILRSADLGENWQEIQVTVDTEHNFNEHSLLELKNGEIISVIRSIDWPRDDAELVELGYLWLARSNDGGLSWSEPERTPMWGYPGTLILLPDGRILCTYGYRRPPYGIRACLSNDGGRTWLIEEEIVLRDDALSEGPGPTSGQPHDIGYPWTVPLGENNLFTVYYTTDSLGVTQIAGTLWNIPSR